MPPPTFTADIFVLSWEGSVREDPPLLAVSLSLCSGSLPARTEQWKNPHSDRRHQGGNEAEPVRCEGGWVASAERRQKDSSL